VAQNDGGAELAEVQVPDSNFVNRLEPGKSPGFSFSMRAAILLCWIVLVSVVSGQQTLTFVHYNVENYLAMERHERGRGSYFGPKPENETAVLIRIIRDMQPDILGLSEMGPRDQFADFRRRLREAGLDYAFDEFVDGPDEQRHLVLLSRFNIVRRDSAARVMFDLRGKKEAVRRGFLDVTIEVNPEYRLRLIGAHLKSKRPVPEGEALIRRQEAVQLRNRIDTILDREPGTNLLVYGDLNDTKDQPAIQEIIGSRSNPNYMADLWLTDAEGDRWTHFRRATDTYARIDYILVSRALFGEVDREKSRIYRSRDWNEASDHRPLVAVVRAVDGKR
jgi:endonuclease/exonuclease/phosphatase family metal-dependent hydrolase